MKNKMKLNTALITAKLSYLRIAPRKVRLVADLIRGKKIEEAQTILNFTNKKAAQPLLKLLKQAISNAKNKFQIEALDFYISKLIVDEGPKLKRWMPRARGRASEIQKKTSHIILQLDSKAAKSVKIKKEEKIKGEEKILKTKRFKIKPTEKQEKKFIKPAFKKEIKKTFRRKAF
jgi:large subunit ribosomal protein L22